MSFSAELEFANGLADMADEISMHYWRRRDTQVRSKPDGTPVTQADEEIERALRKEIAAAFPEHGVLGEEEGESEGVSGARWILDPIDGTKNYSWGIPLWGTLIALEVAGGPGGLHPSEGEIVAGVVSCPAVGERYSAGRRLGATRNGETIRVSDVDDLSKARVAFTSVRSFIDQDRLDQFLSYVASSKHNRGIGDCYGHMLVASGSMDAMVEPRLSAWDLGPLIVIVEEAGGRFTDVEGNNTIYGQSVVTSNGRIHEAVLGVFRA
jgi:histidinol-phosphatase